MTSHPYTESKGRFPQFLVLFAAGRGTEGLVEKCDLKVIVIFENYHRPLHGCYIMAAAAACLAR